MYTSKHSVTRNTYTGQVSLVHWTDFASILISCEGPFWPLGCRTAQLSTLNQLDNSPNARPVENSSPRPWCTSHRVTSHCAPRACVPPRTRFICPNVPAEAPTGHPKAPKWPYIGSKLDQSGVNIDPHCAKQFKMGQTLSKLTHMLQDGCPVGTNSPNLA